MTAELALLAAYPGAFSEESARAWVAARRALLRARAGLEADTGLSVSSGCAASGARTHALELAEDAAHALTRLEAGLGTVCERCDAVLPLDRIDSAPAAVSCTTCARPYEVETRWCR